MSVKHKREGPNSSSFQRKEGKAVCREQKTVKAGWVCEGRLETESSRRARSMAIPERPEGSGAEDLVARMLARDNLNQAYKRVKRNKGAAGVDGMTVEGLGEYLRENKEQLLASLENGSYQPQPVRRVRIPKPEGGERLLGVPTVADRFVQQALLQVLQPIFEGEFSEHSFGFRPGRSAHQALRQAREYYKEGYTYVVDIDLAKYFDTVNHDILMSMVREVVPDKRVNRLIRGFLKSGVMEHGLTHSTEEGTPQGGNLSPLLSNLYLTRFDRMLESRGHRFVRYADDCNIYVKSRRAAERVMESCTRYLEGKLRLTVNREKSQAGSPLKLKFLGFSLYEVKGKTGIRVHEKSLQRLKQKLRDLTSRKQPMPMEDILLRLKRYMEGWLGYYSLAEMGSRLQQVNEWLRRRIRQIYWKRWKRVRNRFRELKRLGIDEGKAWEWANSRLGYWRVAGSWILTRTLTNKYLASQGYLDISERYKVLHSNC